MPLADFCRLAQAHAAKIVFTMQAVSPRPLSLVAERAELPWIDRDLFELCRTPGR